MERETRQLGVAVPLGFEAGGSYGYDYDMPEIELPEIVVTPDGVYKGEGWDDFFGSGNDDDTDPYGLGGGSHSGNSDNMTQAEIEANGRQAVSLFVDSILNQTAVWFKEIQETKSFKSIQASNLVANAPGFQEDLIKTLNNNTGILNTWGKAFARSNAWAGEVIAVIGVLDGNPRPGDIVNLIGATIGLIGTSTIITFPIVSLTCTGVSLVCTLIGSYLNSTYPSEYK